MELSKSVCKVLMLSDSRGRNLESLLNTTSKRIKFQVKVLPGASIGTLAEKMHQLVGMTDPVFDLIVIMGGICSITRITYLPFRAAVPQSD